MTTANPAIKIVKIGEAAQILGVSVKTLRRWEEEGKLQSIRTPGGTRLYSLENLKKFNPKAASTGDVKKIGEAAAMLGVSVKTLRRWEDEGKIESIRTPGGTRLYSLSTLSNFDPHSSSGKFTPAPKVKGDFSSQTQDMTEALKLIPQNTPKELILREEAEKIIKRAQDAGSNLPVLPQQSRFHLSYIYASAFLVLVMGAAISLLTFSHNSSNQTASELKQNKLASSGVLGEEVVKHYLDINADVVLRGDLAVSGSVNGLNLNPGEDGFSLSGGTTTARSLTVTGGDVTLDQDVSTRASPTFTAITLSGDKNQLLFTGGSALSWAPTGSAKTITLPDASGTMILDNASQTLTNKTLSGASNTFSNIPLSALAGGGSFTVSAGTNLSGGGSLTFGESVSLSLKDAVTLTSLTTTGNVGVGTTSTGTYALDVNGILNTTDLYLNGSKLASSQWTTAGNDIYYTTGNVGIGTTAPGAALEVNGQVKITGGNPGSNKILTSDTNGLATWGSVATIGGISGLGNIGFVPKFDSSSSITNSAIWSDASGNVGIGTTNPTSKLQVNGDVSATTFNGIGFTGTAGTTMTFPTASDTLAGLGTTQTFTGINSFMGNVGIGTTSPNYLFEVDSAGSALLSLDSTSFTTNVPANFTAPGDVAIAYDLNMTNPTASYIKSAAPLYLQAGESFNSSDLTLRTFNSGNIIFDSGNVGITQAQNWTLPSSTVNALSFATNLLSLDTSNNRVGIGTTSPETKLNVSGGNIRMSSGQQLQWGSGTVTEYITGSQGTNFLSFTTNGSERMRITSTGNVGIGTTAPTANLEIFSNSANPLYITAHNGANAQAAYIKTAADASLFSAYISTSSTQSWVAGQFGTSNFVIRDNTSTTTTPFTIEPDTLDNTLYLKSSGNVGIGTTAPNAPLAFPNTTGDKIYLYGNGTSNLDTYGFGVYSGETRIFAGASSDTNKITFGSQAGSTYTERMRISTGGNVGIGTTAPNAPLQVNGNVNATTFNGIGFTGTAGTTMTFPTASDTLAGLAQTQTFTGINSFMGNVGIGTTSPQNLLSLSSTSTSLSSAMLNLDWSPATATTLSGDLFSLNIGANGTATNLFNIKDNGSSIFSVSQTQITAGVPTQFTSDGDVSIAYDINFTNAIGSYIKSQSPLAIVAGETFGSSNLTLSTYNSGQVVLDAVGGVTLNQAQNWTLPSSTVNALSFATNLLSLDTSNNRVGIGTTSPSSLFDVNSKFNVTSNGNVGIGTTAPTAKVAVVGGDIALDDNRYITSNGYQLLTSYAGDTYLGLSNNTLLRSGSSNTMYLKSDGSVGIGTITPVAQLDVRNTSTGTGLHMYVGSSAGQFSVLNNGNVGIGTTNPVAKLDVSSGQIIANSIRTPQLQDYGGNLTIMTVNSGRDIIFSPYTGQNSYFSTGNVGIGTTAPGRLLDIAGALRLDGITAPTTPAQGDVYSNSTDHKLYYHNGTSWIDLTAATSGSVPGGTLLGQTLYYNGATWALSSNLFNDNTNVGIGTTTPEGKLVVMGGNVGIGTTAPGQALQVAGSVDITGSYLVNGVALASGIGPAASHTAGYIPVFATSTTIGNSSIFQDAGGNIGIGTTAALNGLFSVMGGNVGIGTTSPGALLDVSGSIKISNSAGSILMPGNSGGVFTMNATDRLYISGKDINSASNIFMDAGQYLQIDKVRANGVSGLSLYDDGGNGLFVQDGGNVGIGTTSPNNKLDVYGAKDNSNGFNLGTLAVYDTTSVAAGVGGAVLFGGQYQAGVYTVGPSISAYKMNGTSGDYGFGLQFWTRKNGDAFGTSRMTIDSLGNVGIGTTSPTSKLQVTGNVGATTFNGMALTSSTGTFTLASGKTFTVNNTLTLAGTDSTTMTFPGASDTLAGLGTTQTFTGANTFNGNLFFGGSTGILGSNGNVGIGTTGPIVALDVATIGRFQDRVMIGPGQGESIQVDSSDWAIKFNTANNERMRINTNGNVGIGNTNPQELLSVGSSINSINIGNGDSVIGAWFRNDGTNTVLSTNIGNLWLGYGGNLKDVYLMGGGYDPQLTIKSTGNVGIGTTSPSTKLQVSGSGNTSDGFQIINASGSLSATAGTQYAIVANPTAAASLTTAIGMFSRVDTAASAVTITNAYGFYATNPSKGTGSTITNNYGLYIENQTAGSTNNYALYSNGGTNYFAGNVGIGTTNPSYKFQLGGTGDNAAIALRRTDGTDGVSHIYTLGNNGGSITYGTDLKSLSGQFQFWTDSSPGDTNNNLTQVVTILNNGNVGIGTTNPLGALSFANTTGDKIYLYNTGSGNQYGLGTYNNELRIFTGLSSNFISFGSQASGTAFSEKMRIENTGNVGIGTTGPGYKLDVQGGNINIGGGVLYLQGAHTRIYMGSADHVFNPGASATTYFGETTDTGAYSFRSSGTVSTAGSLVVSGTGNTTIAGNVGIGTTAPGHLLEVAGNLGLAASSYINFGAANGDTSYGIKDNSGTLQYKNSGGSWANLGAGTSQWDSVTGGINYAGGNVGIGTTSPNSLLHVYGSGAVATTIQSTNNNAQLSLFGSAGQIFNSAGALYITNDAAAGDLIFRAGSSAERMRILSTGNVGIGTTGPRSSLDIGTDGGILTIGGTGSGGKIRFGSNNDINAITYASNEFGIYTNQANGINFYTNNPGVNRMRIDNNGNVGIGTTVPAYKLDVNGAGNFNGTVIAGQSFSLAWSGRSIMQSPADGQITLFNNAINNFSRLNFGGTTSSFPALAVNGSDLQVIRADGSTNANLLVSGNVGIGTTSPSSLLQVGLSPLTSGYASTSLTVNGAADGDYTAASFINTQQSSAGSTNETSAISLGWRDAGAASANAVKILAGKEGDYTSASNANSFLSLYTTASNSMAERLRITSSGNVGIGTTNPGKKLEVYVASAAPTQRWRGWDGNYWMDLIGNSAGGAEVRWDFSTYNNGTTLTPISILGASGNVGIGTTSPGRLLDIAGALRLDGITAPTTPAQGDVYSNSADHKLYYHNGTSWVDLTAAASGSVPSGTLAGQTLYYNGASWATSNNLFNNNGNVGIGTTSPTTQMEIGSLAGADSTFSLSDGDVSHTFTSLASANTYLKAQPLSSTLGGTLLTGFSSGDSGAFQIKGLIGSGTPANSTPAVKIIGSISDGMGGQALLNSLNTLFQVQNYTNDPSFTIRGNGSVGIGTTSPGYILDVQHATSKVNSKNGYLTNGADYAEWFASSDPTLSPGEVVSFDNSSVSASRALTGYDKNLLGVVSTKPGYIGNNPFKSASEEEANTQSGRYKLIAMVGQVPVKVSLEGGIISVGDYLTSSSTEGVAMKAVRPGQVLGKALTPFDGSSCLNPDGPFCQGSVTLLINVSYADPANFLASVSLDNGGNLIVPNLKVEKLFIKTSDASVSSLVSDGTTISYIDKNNAVSEVLTTNSKAYYDLTGRIATMEDKMSSYEAKMQNLAERVANLEATSSAAPVFGPVDESSSSSQIALTPPDILMATGSATIANLEVTSQATFSGTLTAYQASISDTFKSLGNTFLGNTTIAGDFTVDGTMSISGDSINSIGTGIARNAPAGILYIQNSPLAGAVNFFNGLAEIDTTGKLTAQSVSAGEYLGVAGKVVGSGTISAGTKSVDIANSLVKASSRILVTVTSNSDTVIRVTGKTAGQKFTVSVPAVATSDINFDWLIVNESN